MRKLFILSIVSMFFSCTGSSSYFSVGGRISGVTGEIILQNNGKDDLVITKGGDFTFELPIVEGQPYEVTVKKRPSGVTCVVTKASGTVSKEITNVKVSCSSGEDPVVLKAWTYPANLADHFSPSSTPAYNPQLAMDDEGNAIIVWQQNDGGGMQIYKAEFRNGIWTYPADLSDYISPAQGADAPQVAMDNNGNAIIVWTGTDGNGDTQIFKSEYRNGAWVNPVDVNDNISPDGSSSNSPQVAMDDNGNALIVWHQGNLDGDAQVFKSEYRSGAWTHPINTEDNISPDGTDAQYSQVAMDDDGNALIIWTQQNGVSTNQIFKSEYRSGAWTHPADVNDNISPDVTVADLPRVAMDNNANAIIIWRQNNGFNDQVFKSEYRSGAWTHPADVNDNISPDGFDVDLPEVAMDNNGNAIVVWRGFDMSMNAQTFKSEYRSGTWINPVNSEDNLSADGTGVETIDVAMDDNDNVIIAWYQSDGSNQQIYKSEYRNGAWVNPSGIADFISQPGFDALVPQVKMSNDETAIITWQQTDGSNEHIFKAEYR